jgi:hypothetical protein
MEQPFKTFKTFNRCAQFKSLERPHAAGLELLDHWKVWNDSADRWVWLE